MPKRRRGEPPYAPPGEEYEDDDSPISLSEIEAGLPELPFLLHIDQVMALLDMSERDLMAHAHRRGIDYGEPRAKHLALINIAPTDQPPSWRVDYKELRRWCRSNRIPTYQW